MAEEPAVISGAASEAHSLVVLGAMNPRIHHPEWYHAIGSITDDERDLALGAEMVCVMPFAQFRFGHIHITCQPDRWDIRTDTRAQRDRLLSIATRVFDKLFETSIGAFGFNSDFERPTSCPSVAKYLASLVQNSLLGVSSGGEHSANIMYRIQSEHINQYSVSPVERGKHLVAVHCNSEYKTGRGYLYFDLGKEMRKNFERDLSHAVEMADRVAGLISSHGGLE